MNNKGQLFSLDLIIAIALVILAVGLLYRQAELFQYFSKDSDIQSELYRIGLNASNQLVSNPAIVCELVDAASPPNVIGYLPNCLAPIINNGGNCPAGLQELGITKSSLGIPEGYDCSIDFKFGKSNEQCLIKLCNANSSSASENVFSIERKIVRKTASAKDNDWKDRTFSKADFDSCVRGSCTALEESSFILQVWKE